MTTTLTGSGITFGGSSTLNNPSGSAPSYAARAWVNFNGTGTVAIRASGNVSSITDNGVGDYTLNFSTGMPDANYAPVAACDQSGTGGLGDDNNVNYQPWSFSSSSVRAYVSYTDVKVDCVYVCVSYFR